MTKLLTKEEEKSLFERLRNGDESVKEVLVECNIRLVDKVAAGFVRPGVEFDDLVQEGLIGLLTAIDKFDHTKGYKFSTYATWYVQQSIRRYIGNFGKIIRLPIHVNEKINRKKINRILKARYSIEQKKGCFATTEEISRLTGYTEEEVESYLAYATDVISLNQYVNDEKVDAELINFIQDDTIDVEEMAIEKEVKEEVRKILDSLPERESMILKMRFGFGCNLKTLAEIGNIFGLTRERIRQIQNNTLKELRRNRKVKERLREIMT